MKVKICGISNEIDALKAIELGADAIGFVMGGKVLPVEVEPYAQWVRQTIKLFPSHVDSFLVTHLWDAQDIVALAHYIGCTGIQVSEDIALEEIAKVRHQFSGKIIKTIVSNDTQAKQKLNSYSPFCNYFLLDSRALGYTGGTGKENDWGKSAELVALATKPVFIAGGLSPSNVANAIGLTKPYGVDVSTGVGTYSERYLKKDKKDHEKIRTFIALAKGG